MLNVTSPPFNRTVITTLQRDPARLREDRRIFQGNLVSREEAKEMREVTVTGLVFLVIFQPLLQLSVPANL